MIEIDVHKIFENAGLAKNDTVMMHGNAGVAAQFFNIEKRNRVHYLIDSIVDYFYPNGTVIFPTFSYSFTRKIDFDRDTSPSELGQFSENCRKFPKTIRSLNPNFSVACIGRESKKYAFSRIDDAFGEGTIFDLVRKNKVYLICLGCDFNKISFTHYVEQAFKVPYRYFKKFSGNILINKKKFFVKTTYFTRRLDINTKIDLNKLKLILLKKKKLNIVNIGRFPIYVTNSSDFYENAKNLLKQNPYSLIQLGNEKNFE